MRRLIYLLLLTVFVGASVSCVSASTDCERWYVAYRQELAHSHHLQRLAAAKRRAKLYARRKLAGYTRPAAKPHPPVKRGRPMNRRQTLRHFDLACGVLPEREEDAPKVAEEVPPEFHPERPLGSGVDLLPADFGDMMADSDVPPPFDNGTTPGGPPVMSPPVGGGGPGGPGGFGGYPPPSGGGTPPPSVPPLTSVPEPGSYVLMLTGVLGATGVIRRRFQR